MGRAYDGKKRWNETVLRTNAAAAAAATAQRAKKTKRFSGRTMKLSKAMQHVDEETRAIVRNARLDALEADNFGVDAPENGDGADDASDDMYVDEDDTTGGGGGATAGKDKKARKNRKPAGKAKAKKWKVKSLAQLVFEEHGAGDDDDNSARRSADARPTYLSVAAGASTRPPRRFCCVCGFFAVYACTRCGSRYCRVKCGDQHKESGCLKFGL